MMLNYALYSYAFLAFDSWLSPVTLICIIALTVGLREVAADLSNPFGDDEVDFNLQGMMFKMRGTVSRMVFKTNQPALRPRVPGDEKAMESLLHAKAVMQRTLLQRARERQRRRRVEQGDDIDEVVPEHAHKG